MNYNYSIIINFIPFVTYELPKHISDNSSNYRKNWNHLGLEIRAELLKNKQTGSYIFFYCILNKTYINQNFIPILTFYIYFIFYFFLKKKLMYFLLQAIFFLMPKKY
jgi:hypothetical protein